MRRFLAAVLSCTILSPLAALADVEPGNWELSMTSTIQGMAVGPIVKQQCLTAADAADPARVFGPQGGSGCQFSNRRDTGSEMSFDIMCGGQVPMTGNGKVRYSRDTMEADLQLAADS